MSSQTPQSQELFLILHKVRGEPAFDIATKVQIGDEEGWIIPTSGHRAYPYQAWLVEDLFDGSDYPHHHPHTHLDKYIPEDLPDHYSTTAAPRPSIRGIVERLGLIRPSTFTKRAF